MSDLYTDRRDGPRPRTETRIGNDGWRAIAALIQSRLNSSAFGYAFPERCPDGSAMYGCDETAFFQALRGVARFPELSAQFRGGNWGEPEKPPTDTILDGMEWCASKIGTPQAVYHHTYFRHDHLRWDREAGLGEWISEVNQILSRQGLAYEMADDGRIRRLVEGPATETLSRALFDSGDSETDKLLEHARRRFFDREPDAAQNAIEALWDAFERFKTHLDPDKKVGAAAILTQRAPEEAHKMLDTEMRELTAIGNAWRIRHHEINKCSLGPGRDLRDYLFLRMFSILWLLLGRAGPRPTDNASGPAASRPPFPPR